MYANAFWRSMLTLMYLIALFVNVRLLLLRLQHRKVELVSQLFWNHGVKLSVMSIL